MNKPSSIRSPEFLLVVIMLVTLTVMVFGILLTPVNIGKGKDDQVEVTTTQIIEYKKSLLTVIVTAFGAWVGAGAAYYFGRENMRQASESLLAMRELSPKERLKKITVGEVNPKPLLWLLKKSDTIDTAIQRLKHESYRWFVPVVDEEGKLVTVLHEEAFWRFSHDQFANGSEFEATGKKTVADLLEGIRQDESMKHMDKIHVTASLDHTVAHVSELMKEKDGFLAVLVDDNHKPTHFVTTGDVRKVLMNME